MNEINIKYWLRDFQKIFFIDFLDELGFFIKRKPIFTRKNFRRCVGVFFRKTEPLTEAS
jgi:hypothetical protein